MGVGLSLAPHTLKVYMQQKVARWSGTRLIDYSRMITCYLLLLDKKRYFGLII